MFIPIAGEPLSILLATGKLHTYTYICELNSMWRRDNTLSLGGYQLPRKPTMKGKTSTLVYFCRRVCHRGWYFSTLELAASSRAVGEPSNGQQTSTMMIEDSSGEMMVRSGLLAPRCPRKGGLFFELCPHVLWDCSHNPLQARVVPLTDQCQIMVTVVDNIGEGFRHPSTETALGGWDPRRMWQRAWTVHTGSRLRRTLWMNRYW